MWSASRGVLHERARSRKRPLACTRSSSSCVPVSANGMLPGGDLLEHGGLALDPDHLEAAIGERERQRKAHPAEADDGDALRHRTAL